MADKVIHSTGRGGAGNIGPDPGATYVDGDIVRESLAPADPAIAGAGSHGRGGAGNIKPSPRNSPALKPQQHGQHAVQAQTPLSEDVVPESATRDVAHGQADFHTGRGGSGNAHREKYGGHSHAPKEEHKGESIMEKAKHAIGLDKHHHEKKGEPAT